MVENLIFTRVGLDKSRRATPRQTRWRYRAEIQPQPFISNPKNILQIRKLNIVYIQIFKEGNCMTRDSEWDHTATLPLFTYTYFTTVCPDCKVPNY